MPRNNVRILHVEDDEIYADLMHAILKDGISLNHYDIVHVTSLKKALCELKSNGFEAVLLDLSLNDISGIDNVRVIKEEHPDLPIIVLSGIDNEATAMDALDEGAQDYIVKGYANSKVVHMSIQSSIKRKAMERDLFYRANYDDLTGLSNRKNFLMHATRSVNTAKRLGRHCTLLFIDIDRFKQINDMYGHAAGNAVLKEAGARLKSALRTTDMVARYGGDEFVVLLDHAEHTDTKYISAGVVNKLQNAFNLAMDWQDKKLEFTASIGIAIYPDAGDDLSAMLTNADNAMYEAKKQGGSRFRFSVCNDAQ